MSEEIPARYVHLCFSLSLNIIDLKEYSYLSTQIKVALLHFNVDLRKCHMNTNSEDKNKKSKNTKSKAIK